MSFIDNLRGIFGPTILGGVKLPQQQPQNVPKDIDKPSNQPRKVTPEERYGYSPNSYLERGDIYADTVNRRKDFESMLDQFSSTDDHMDRLNLLKDAKSKFGNNAFYDSMITRLGNEEEAYYNLEAYIDDVPNIGNRYKQWLNEDLGASRWSSRRV